MMRYVIIAARSHVDTYGYLRRQFAGDETVQVLLDRRHTERRRRQASYSIQRRRQERRFGRGWETDLATRGFLIVRQAVALQWRPPWWGVEAPERRGDFERQPGPRHLARLIVRAIALSHGDKIAEAIKRDDLFESLARELEEGRRCYEKNREASAVGGPDYFDQAIVDVLVKDQGNVESKIW